MNTAFPCGRSRGERKIPKGGNMKICKNCGYAADDAQLRCPRCGDLFEEDMDSMLREMRNNLNSYKNEVSAAPQQPVAAPAQPVQPVQPVAGAGVQPVQSAQPVQSVPVQPVQGTAQGDAALQEELARVRGELRAMQAEMDRVSGARGGYVQPQMPVIVQPVTSPAPQQPTVIYQAYPAVPQAVPAAGAAEEKGGEAAAKADKNAKYKPGKKRAPKIRRCGSRIFISVVALLMIAASVAMFFFDWVKSSYGGFSGFDILAALGGSDRGAAFEAYVATYINGTNLWFNAVATACKYILRYGVIVYGVLLILGLPVLFSLGGRVKFKGWHTFCAWSCFIVALLFFLIFLLATGFSSMTIWFLLGAGANFVRCIFLLFYKGYDHEVDITFRKETKLE